VCRDLDPRTPALGQPMTAAHSGLWRRDEVTVTRVVTQFSDDTIGWMGTLGGRVMMSGGVIQNTS
jgi:hypothetical protein